MLFVSSAGTVRSLLCKCQSSNTAGERGTRTGSETESLLRAAHRQCQSAKAVEEVLNPKPRFLTAVIYYYYSYLVFSCFDLAALGCLQIRDRGFHLGASTAGSEGEPGDDAGISPVNSCEYPGGAEEQDGCFWGGRKGFARACECSDHPKQRLELNCLARCFHPV